MTELAVVVLSSNEEQRTILQMQIDATAVAKSVQAHDVFPIGASDTILRRIKDSRADVILVDVPKQDPFPAIRALELLRVELPLATSALFATGDASQPQVIISAMRAGAREFLERPTSTKSLLEAFVRLSSSQRTVVRSGERGKMITFVNAKGGCGATTMAVNTAVALQKSSGDVALVDLAPMGNAALHLNAKPRFSVLDVIPNLQRLDQALLGSYITRCDNGLHLLAGSAEPLPDEGVSGDLARLFDLLTTQYRIVVVDTSTRFDRVLGMICDLSDTVLLTATTELASLWSAAKMQRYLERPGDNKLKLLLNRFRKIPGFAESDIESITHAKLICKIPNQYAAVASAIERGTPIVEQNHSEVARSFVELANLLGTQRPDPKRKHFTLWGN